jgi:hypothetical protein
VTTPFEHAAPTRESPSGAAAAAATAPRPFACVGSAARSLVTDLGWCAGIALTLTLLTTPFVDVDAMGLPVLYAMYAIVTIAIGMTCSNLYRWVFPRAIERWPSRGAQVAIHAAIVLVSAVVGGEIGTRLCEALLPVRMGDSRTEVIQIGLTVCTIVVLLALANEGLRARAREMELRAERARLAALQARTDPHFLFNSLNTVAGMIDEEPRKAERMLELLSSQFRYSLEGSREAEVPLREELDAVRDYLEIQSIRLGDRLRARVLANDSVDSVMVPPLVLQPLVENAVLHGVSPRRHGGAIDVHAGADAGKLLLAVTDDGPGPGHSSHTGSGTSLTELRERLNIAYGARAEMDAGPAEGGGFRVTIRLPLVKERRE